MNQQIQLKRIETNQPRAKSLSNKEKKNLKRTTTHIVRVVAHNLQK